MYTLYFFISSKLKFNIIKTVKFSKELCETSSRVVRDVDVNFSAQR